MSKIVDLILNCLFVIFESFNNSVALLLTTETSEREANVPLSSEVVEAKHSILRNIGHCYHCCAILVHTQIVVSAFVVEILSAGASCVPEFTCILCDGMSSVIIMNGKFAQFHYSLSLSDVSLGNSIAISRLVFKFYV
jgi:hypothetical protein